MKEYCFRGISILQNTPKVPTTYSPLFGIAEAKEALRFHQSLPCYRETRMVSLHEAAAEYHVGGIYVKDESERFGLKAFKGLGGSYSMFRILCLKTGLNPKTADYRDFQDPGIRQLCSGVHFVTATDGNHGKGVSWAAALFGCSATVYMPKGTVESRRAAIEAAGNAHAEITDSNYDQTVAYAKRMAAENGWVLLQDTAWDGYEQIPEWIIDGYLTLAEETVRQLKEICPTHVLLQAGVGAMAGGVLDYLRTRFSDATIQMILVEPTEAACVYHSAKAADGSVHSLPGNPQTIMAGLNCGTPCKITWPIMRDQVSFFCACDDDIAKQGMLAYAKPVGEDPLVVSGESGAVTYGLLLQILENQTVRDLFKISENSVFLLINTEGDTDPEGYLRVLQVVDSI